MRKSNFFGSVRHDQMLVQSQIVFINFPSPKVWDEADYVVPPAENGAFFVTTNVVITPNQTWGECPEVWIVHDQHHKYHGYHLHHQCCYKSYQSSHFVMSRGVHQTFSNIIISETHSSSFLDYIVNKYTLNKIYFSPVCRHGFSLSLASPSWNLILFTEFSFYTRLKSKWKVGSWKDWTHRVRTKLKCQLFSWIGK